MRDSIADTRMLYLVRHGAIAGAEPAYVGQVERPLSEEGLREALRLRVLLEHFPVRHVYASDLRRSVQTAELITDGMQLDIQVRREFREISLGDWEGRTFTEIKRRFPKEYKARGEDLEHWRPPGGESFGDCRDRVLPALSEVMEAAEGNVLIVGHAGVNRVILCDVFGMPVGNLFRIGQEYGCLNIIAYRKGERCVRLLNFAPWGLPSEIMRERVELELVAAL